MPIPMTHPKPIAQILPPRLRARLLTLSVKAELTAQEYKRGRDDPAYLAVIREIDAAREEARTRCPHLFRYGPADSLDRAPRNWEAA